MDKRWNPHVPVATVIEHEGRFLLVEEHTADGLRLNNPAGHLDPGESPAQGAARETLEETAYHFRPTHVVGVYHWKHPTKEDTTYLRFAFGGELLGFEPDRKLDDGIVAARWLTLDEVRATQARHRSPLILRCCEDLLAGKRYPLDLLVHYG